VLTERRYGKPAIRNLKVATTDVQRRIHAADPPAFYPCSAPHNLHADSSPRPSLKANRFHCHGEDGKTKGGLDARLRHLLAKGGEHGAASIPGQPEKNLGRRQ
jgi:Planctomycete cytochrome C